MGEKKNYMNKSATFIAVERLLDFGGEAIFQKKPAPLLTHKIP